LLHAVHSNGGYGVAERIDDTEVLERNGLEHRVEPLYGPPAAVRVVFALARFDAIVFMRVRSARAPTQPLPSR